MALHWTISLSTNHPQVRPLLLSCRELAAAGLPDAKKSFLRCLNTAAAAAPTLIILDDLHLLLPAPEGDAAALAAGGAGSSHALAQLLGELMDAHGKAACAGERARCVP